MALLTRVIADAVAAGLVARAGGAASGVVAEEPLAEWERELLAASDAPVVAAEAVVAEPVLEEVVVTETPIEAVVVEESAAPAEAAE